MVGQSPPEHAGATSDEVAALVGGLGGRNPVPTRGESARDKAGISMAAVIGSTLLGVHAPQRLQPQV